MVLVNKKQQTVPLHHRKVQGYHHKRGKTYEKSYWPFLPLLSIAGFAVLLSLAWPGLHRSKAMVLGTSIGITNQQLLRETNLNRDKLAISQLQFNAQLASAAQAKAQSMASQNYWAHQSPDGRQPWTFARLAHYDYQAMGENLAYGFTTTDDVINGWLNSQEHRANMLDPAYQNVGFGVVHAANYLGKGPETIVVAMYGRPLEATPLAAQNQNSNSSAQASQPVTRVELMAANAIPGILAIVVIAAAGAAALFIYRHTRYVHRAFVYSEAFVVKHHGLDILAISVIALGVLLTRTAGFIQ